MNRSNQQTVCCYIIYTVFSQHNINLKNKYLYKILGCKII